SIPTQRGLAPGNGAFVNLLKELTSATPEVAGKPFSPLFAAAAATVTGKVLMLGDRLDTDIEGAKRQGIASAWVNTGVHHIGDVLNAPTARRPEFLLGDL
ncbi:MAG: HAD hydrolase-like protein, partial [Actinomycetales bacterium]|nr:HAD hydrolase-like protein [Actinomycetales bacterium]